MNERPKKELIEEVATLRNIDPAFIEKDWFVTQVVSILANLRIDGFEFIFTGGTALSKAHDLIQRFSEDVDFRIIAPENSRGSLSKFKRAVIDELKNHDFAITDDQIRARDGNSFFSVDLNYESYFARPGALRPHIQLEVKVRDTQRKPIYLPVASFVNLTIKHPPEVDRIACIDPVESAADKLSALAWRIPDRVRGASYDDPSIVRHIHDLALLKDKAQRDADFPDLVIASMQEDDRRSKNNPSFAGSSISDKFQQMLKSLEKDKQYVEEYERFVQGVSYAAEGQAPDFATAIQIVRELAMQVMA